MVGPSDAWIGLAVSCAGQHCGAQFLAGQACGSVACPLAPALAAMELRQRRATSGLSHATVEYQRLFLAGCTAAAQTGARLGVSWLVRLRLGLGRFRMARGLAAGGHLPGDCAPPAPHP